MSIFNCKACEAHKSHIKSLEAQITYFKQQMEPVQQTFEIPDNYSPPVLEPQYLPIETNRTEITPDQLLSDEY